MSDQAPSIPSVLAIVVVKNGAPWLRQTLRSLARQSHRRVAILAVDNGSTDDTPGILQEVLGPRRTIRLGEDMGFAGAVARGLRVPAAREADYVLLLHDDAALAPDAVERLVETARRVRGAGVVGPKVLDWSEDRRLLDIGKAADRFGYPYSPLEEGEIDQGQYDGIREVLFLSSPALLVAREVWTRIGPPDERLRTGQPELDFCWRARLAGFRVLVDPGAVVAHRLAGEREEREGGTSESDRYLSERAGLLAVLTSYRLFTLLWILPLYVVQAVGRFLFYLLTGHGERAGDVARAWGWNLARLPGTVRRRFRAQRARRVRDREIARFMAPAGARLQRWALQASSLLVARRTEHVEDEEEPEAPPLRRRVASVAVSHPVAVGGALAILVTLIAFRDVLFVARIEGGSLPVLPGKPFDFFQEFVGAWRTTGFGGPGGGSPALVVLGLGSILSFTDPMLLTRLLVAFTPLLAAMTCYGAVARVTRERGSAVVAAGCYALSALGMWVASEGSLPAMALLVSLPWLTLRFAEAFGRAGPVRPFRWVVGTALVLAVAGSFFPAIWLAAAMGVVPLAVVPPPGGSRFQGLGLASASVFVAAVLVFPFTAQLVRAGGGTTVGAAGIPDLPALFRLSPGPAPGSWVVALFLPVTALVSYAFAEGRGGWAGRTLATAALGIPLAWLAAAGQLPRLLANPLAYLAPAAFSLSLLVGLGVRSLVPEVRHSAFGVRQFAVVAVALVLGAGLGLQMVRALGGDWAVGERRVPPAWPVVAAADPGEPFRVLWLDRPDGGRFRPPGGDPQGLAEAGPATVSYGVTGRAGRSALAVGLPGDGPAYEHLEAVLESVLSGRIRHGGALLAPFAIRFVVAGESALPAAALERLDGQLDLDLIQSAGGLRIYRNARALPEAVVAGASFLVAARSPDPLAPSLVDPTEWRALRRGPGPSWSGPASAGGPVYLATTFDRRWEMDGRGGAFPAFGWATGFEASSSGTVRVAYEPPVARSLEVAGLAVLWAGALVVLTRRGRRARRGPAHRQVAVDPVAVADGDRRPAGRPVLREGGR